MSAKKPHEQQRRLGNPSHVTQATMPKLSEVALIAPATEIPEADVPLGEWGLKFWNWIWKSVPWLTPESDYRAVIHCAELEDEYVQLRARVLKYGNWRERAQLRSLSKEKLALYDRFGLNPSARAILGVAEVRIQDSIALRDERQGAESKTIIVEALTPPSIDDEEAEAAI